MTKLRVITALIIGPLAIWAILMLSTRSLACVTGLLFLAGLSEWLRLSGLSALPLRSGVIACEGAFMWVLFSVAQHFRALLYLVSLAGIAWWIMACLWLSVPYWGHLLAKLTAGMLATIAAWSAVMILQTDGSQGRFWLLTAITLVWGADSAAYFVGRQFGRRPLAPRISPNKTVEGAIGGICAGVLVVYGFGIYVAGAPIRHWPSLLLVGVVVSVASIIGDLFESLLKRQAGAKDSGHWIPGHGGVLDRIDGVLAALPLFALSKEILTL